MPVRSGLDVLPELHSRFPAARIVVLSNFPRARMADITRREGAVGYVEKGAPPEGLVSDILLAAALVATAASSASSQFPAQNTAAKEARDFVRHAISDADEDLVDSVTLLVSELVTNAVLHASSAPRVDIHLSEQTVRVEVYDDDPAMPRARAPEEGASGGRGLLLVERIASRWGAQPQGRGKVVWFELLRPGVAT
jgi:anti-sigma regulatory factor (Ser/Thr protein kinase)